MFLNSIYIELFLSAATKQIFPAINLDVIVTCTNDTSLAVVFWLLLGVHVFSRATYVYNTDILAVYFIAWKRWTEFFVIIWCHMSHIRWNNALFTIFLENVSFPNTQLPHSPNSFLQIISCGVILKEGVIKTGCTHWMNWRETTIEINFINISILYTIVTNVVKHVHACINEQCSHFEYVL